jgi:signal transduction histidine kinase
MLDQAGLGDAIRDYVKGFTKRSEIHVELELPPNHLGRMDRDVELTLFRVVQETLTNIQRHSGSQQARVRMDRTLDFLTLEVSDIGRGLSKGLETGKEPLEAGVGIPSMRERIKLIGGRLEINSTHQGTTVRVTIPVMGEGA